MDDKEFLQLVKKAIKTVPEEFLEKLENVEILISDMPNPYQLRKLRARGEQGFFLLGLYEGVPQTKRIYYGVGGNLPDKITIFKLPILSLAKTKEDLKEIVRNTVKHEIAHHFGMDERMVRKAEEARKRVG